MKQKDVEIIIYGAEQICASCVNLPSSKETYEWIEAAVTRKFPNQPFEFTYVDIFQPPEEKEKQQFAQKVIDEDLFYPVITINNKIIGEGSLRLKTLYTELEQYGYKPAEQ
ncbi:YuzD family protein [Bacillus benzoevorans]|uniref:Disulfide oxidoreductase YuzD n=1 Tax=Bacillus benzoevorans TaxID=1456 RepID=A0A7X0HQH9_9BACI|nr:YuzD family protein [Bacillus benzoevorans]MBB6445008.1 disulfide oxidoreductase YuzD [Bacillus benzoevorans]